VPVVLEDALVRESYLASAGQESRDPAPAARRQVGLCEMAAENARQTFGAAATSTTKRTKMVERLRKQLGLRNARAHRVLRHLELPGRQIVGSMVVFDEASPTRAATGATAVKSVAGQDDFATCTRC